MIAFNHQGVRHEKLPFGAPQAAAALRAPFSKNVRCQWLSTQLHRERSIEPA
jgi:hypothetical protein